MPAMTHLLLAADQAAPMQFDWVAHVFTLVVALVAFAILQRLVWPVITKALDAREAKILGDLKAADEAREQAKAALADYERSLANARQEATKMIGQARADAEAVAAELRARNESELSELKQRAMREIDAARLAAVTDLHAESAQLALMIATRILKREVTSDDQQRLVEESLQELAAARRN